MDFLLDFSLIIVSQRYKALLHLAAIVFLLLFVNLLFLFLVKPDPARFSTVLMGLWVWGHAAGLVFTLLKGAPKFRPCP